MIGAVDIGETKLAVGLVDENGKVVAKNEIVTGSDSSYSAGLEEIAGMFREMERYARVEITGIGIGSTGPVDPLTGELGDVDFLPDWRRKNPVRDLAQLFGVNVALENDADAGVLGKPHGEQDVVNRGSFMSRSVPASVAASSSMDTYIAVAADLIPNLVTR